MWKNLSIVVCIATLTAACLKGADDPVPCPYTPQQVKAPQDEINWLADYLEEHQIEAEEDSTGIFYKILKPGTATDTMNLCSMVEVKYVGKLLGGVAAFDSADRVVFPLNMLIDGLQTAIPKVKRDGEIIVYVPPALGYKDKDKYNNKDSLVIPKNSYLQFEIKLFDYTSSN